MHQQNDEESVQSVKGNNCSRRNLSKLWAGQNEAGATLVCLRLTAPRLDNMDRLGLT